MDIRCSGNTQNMVQRVTAQFGPRGALWGLPAAALTALDLCKPLRSVEMYAGKGCAKWHPSVRRRTPSRDQVPGEKKSCACAGFLIPGIRYQKLTLSKKISPSKSFRIFFNEKCFAQSQEQFWFRKNFGPWPRLLPASPCVSKTNQPEFLPTSVTSSPGAILPAQERKFLPRSVTCSLGA